jgi:hypothetical protein
MKEKQETRKTFTGPTAITSIGQRAARQCRHSATGDQRPHRVAFFSACGLALLSALSVMANESTQATSATSPSARISVAAGKTTTAPALPTRADFGRESPSPDARHIADWVVDSGDHRGMPFLIVDKTGAKVFVFAPNGRLQGSSPVLLGAAHGDQSVPGIGDREMSNIRPHERTTPAGRFVAEHGHNLKGEDILWVDYEAAVSMHRVRATNPKERRLERLASPTPADNRISYGCINVPVAFYEKVIMSALAGKNGVVYVLPEQRSAREVFGSYDVRQRSQQRMSGRNSHPQAFTMAAAR